MGPPHELLPYLRLARPVNSVQVAMGRTCPLEETPELVLDNGLAESIGDAASSIHDFAPTFSSATASALTLRSGANDEFETPFAVMPRAFSLHDRCSRMASKRIDRLTCAHGIPLPLILT